MITNQKQLRKQFWIEHPHLAEQARAAGLISKRQNEHCATVRCTFTDWVDRLAKDGVITWDFADRVTL